ncbi:MAG: hypothetical protein WBR26_07240 [Candidatus Acidiferrum sp.]
MTKSNSIEPPKLATWLLEQFSPVLEAPLAGDIIESFREGRSSGWYWRQVLWAVLMAFLRSSRQQWGRFAYAVVCGLLISDTWFSMFPVTAREYVQSISEGTVIHWERIQVQEVRALPGVFDLYARSYGIHWPWSLVYQIAFQTVFQAVIVTFALCAYFGFARISKVQILLRAWMVVVVVLTGSNVAVTFLSVIQPLQSAGRLVLTSMPTIIALLITMRMADPARTARPVSA